MTLIKIMIQSVRNKGRLIHFSRSSNPISTSAPNPRHRHRGHDSLHNVHNSLINYLPTSHTIKMKLAIAAILVASAAAFAPSAPVVSRTTSLGYSIHVFNEDEGIDATFECADDCFLVGELLSRAAVNCLWSIYIIYHRRLCLSIRPRRHSLFL